eukprot:4775022-Amphidinium_carterae.1
MMMKMSVRIGTAPTSTGWHGSCRGQSGQNAERWCIGVHLRHALAQGTSSRGERTPVRDGA